MILASRPEVWFVCGSQHLYGPRVLAQVADHARTIAGGLSGDRCLPLSVVFKPVVTTPEEITDLCVAANGDKNCAGLIVWMHTFSPAKMWIRGLRLLAKPLLHLHTQFNRELPWDTIDMDFMNLNQSAHGDREAGFIHTRMHRERKVVVGHWSDPEVAQRIGCWQRAARAWHDWQGADLCRFGDNMREVAVTEGDKVSAELTLGFSTNGYGVGDLVARVQSVSDGDVRALADTYQQDYAIAPELQKNGNRHDALLYSARLELGLRSFLQEGRFKGFTTTFEDLHGLSQLPGMAVQRLMADGYGFAAEGDWKTAALVRAMKIMGDGLSGGTSFMEDYTYDLAVPGNERVLGAHMLEVCPTIAADRPVAEVHPLGIGGKEDPVRLVFNAAAGPAVKASVVDLGNRFRLVANQVEAITPPAMPNLPVARAVWRCEPDFKTSGAAWILAGGGHHTAYSYSVTAEMLEDFASMAGIEFTAIDHGTTLGGFKQALRSNELYYDLARGIQA